MTGQEKAMALDNIQRLKVFLAVAEIQNISHAAQRLHMAQPAVSRYLRDMDAMVGVSLFERAGRGVRLTEAGHALVPQAKSTLKAIEDFDTAVETIDTQIVSQLRIAASSAWHVILPVAVQRFRQEHPAVHVSLVIGGYTHVLELLRRNEAQIGFLGSGPPSGEFAVEPMGSDVMIAIAPPGHPFARYEVLHRSDITEPLPLVQILHPIVNSYLKAAGIATKTEVEMSGYDAVKQAVACGLGLGFLLRHTLVKEIQQGELAQVRLDIPPCAVSLDALWSTGRTVTPTQQAFLQSARDVLRDMGLDGRITRRSEGEGA